MTIYWIGIPGRATPEQEDRLGAAGLTYKGISGEAFSQTIYDTYFLADAGSEEEAVERVAGALPELKEAWEKKPPHVIWVKDD